jgi:hypothetical protein
MALFDWNERPSPHTGYGDEPATSIKFVHFTGWRDPMPNWQGGAPKLSNHAIGNSDDEVVQYHGKQPWTLTLRMWFATLNDLELMDAVTGRPSTLRIRWGLVNRAGGHKATIGSTDYLVLPDTLLVSLTNRETPTLGFPEATATFRRIVTAEIPLAFMDTGEDDT